MAVTPYTAESLNYPCLGLAGAPLKWYTAVVHDVSTGYRKYLAYRGFLHWIGSRKKSHSLRHPPERPGFVVVEKAENRPTKWSFSKLATVPEITVLRHQLARRRHFSPKLRTSSFWYGLKNEEPQAQLAVGASWSSNLSWMSETALRATSVPICQCVARP